MYVGIARKLGSFNYNDFATIGEVEALLPMIGMLLQSSPEEVKFLVCIRCSIFIGYSNLCQALNFIQHNEICHGKLPLNIECLASRQRW